MKIFKSFFTIFYSIGFIVILVIFSAIISSLGYYNHKVKSKESTNEINVIDNDEIIEISAENSNFITLDVKYRKKQSNKELIAYAMSYYDIYKKQIYMYDITFPSTYVVITEEGKISIN